MGESGVRRERIHVHMHIPQGLGRHTLKCGYLAEGVADLLGGKIHRRSRSNSSKHHVTRRETPITVFGPPRLLPLCFDLYLVSPVSRGKGVDTATIRRRGSFAVFGGQFKNDVTTSNSSVQSLGSVNTI